MTLPTPPNKHQLSNLIIYISEQAEFPKLSDCKTSYFSRALESCMKIEMSQLYEVAQFSSECEPDANFVFRP